MGSIFWIFLCICVGIFASNKGRSGLGWGVLSMIISPLLGAIIVACLKDLKVEENVQQVRMEQQQLKDRVVYNEKFTEYRLNRMENDVDRLSRTNVDDSNLDSKKQTTLIGEGNKECPECGKVIKSEAIKCKYCGIMLNQLDMKECPYCKEYINSNAKKCIHCNSSLIIDLKKAGE